MYGCEPKAILVRADKVCKNNDFIKNYFRLLVIVLLCIDSICLVVLSF